MLNAEFHWLHQVATTSLMVLEFFDAIIKAKKLIRKSIAQNLKQVSLTKSF